jgi:hypothetical protein
LKPRSGFVSVGQRMTSERFHLPAAPLPADNNIRYQYPIHRGKWIRHPAVDARTKSFCRYTLDFALAAPATIELHVSADQRFELFCDGDYVGMGPDRSDLDHWSFHSYRLRLAAGAHRLAAEVYFLGLGPADRPWAQTSLDPGFVLVAENSPVDLNTGRAPWQVTLLEGVTTEKAPVKGFFVVGPNYVIEAGQYFASGPAVAAVAFAPAGQHGETGKIEPGWKLYPSRLPEQLRQPVGGGRVRSVSSIADDAPFPADDPAPQWPWPVTVPPQRRVVVLWDLEQYHTAYPELTVTGGAGSRVKIEWAEACVETLAEPRRKGNRDEVAGKYFVGNGDTFLPDGHRRTLRAFWWRAGRYVRIVVETADAPVTLERLQLWESRFPLANASEFLCSDAAVAGVIGLAARGIQMCAHETYMDCPYYEQMMYVGDTRLQMLTAYLMSREDRLNQRALELFDWSRQETGFVLERCPSQPKQLSCTFAMIWVLMLRDYAWWRNDAGFLRARLKGMRCLLEEFKDCGARSAEGGVLLPALPGWSFVDWVEGLSYVNHPGPKAGVSAVVNLLFLNALNAAAELEEHFGERHWAEYHRAWAQRLAAAVAEKFWDAPRGLFADDVAHRQFSEHAQCLALLSGMFPERESRCFEALVTAPDLLRTTVYFSFYLLETWAKFGRGDLILEKLDFWKAMVALGLKTPLEMPEPSRSDCHGWGSHPLFHLHASVAGIRPASPGFATVRISPQPGPLTELNSRIPHPAGTVALQMKRTGEVWQATVDLPAGVRGVFEWGGKSYRVEGLTSLELNQAGAPWRAV